MRKTKWHSFITILLLSSVIFSFYLNIRANYKNPPEIILHALQSRKPSTNLLTVMNTSILKIQDPSKFPLINIHVPVAQNHSLNVPIIKSTKDQIAVLIIACNRPTVDTIIKKSLQYRPSKQQFPIIVSLDCNDEPTYKIIKSFENEITILRHSNNAPIDLPKKTANLRGYYLLSRHFLWALKNIFMTFGFEACLILEDDLNISPDLFEYFLATRKLLEIDNTLWCVSAWNDNGKDKLINSMATDKIYRTDFFPGLGWMILKNVWLELESKWPPAFWDDWLRRPAQRKNRHCLRPEISRTSTYGKNGVSKGLLFDAHLQHIHHYTGFVKFTQLNLNYLITENYDEPFLREVYGSRLVTLDDLDKPALKNEKSLRIQYNNNSYVKIAHFFGIMEDYKSGMPRTAYRGVVTFMYKSWRIYLCQSFDWSGYKET